MTIHRARLGPDLLQSARDGKPLTLLSTAIVLFSSIIVLLTLGLMVSYLWTALQMRTAQAWNDFWDQTRYIELLGAYPVIGPLIVGLIDGTRLHERAIRCFALLGDDHWAPALDVQPAPLTPEELAQASLDFGTFYGPKANLAVMDIAGGLLIVAASIFVAWLSIWGLQQTWPVPPNDVLPMFAVAALVITVVFGGMVCGVWLTWWGIRLNGGTHLTGDDASLHIYSRRGRERSRIPWHAIRALSAQLPIAGSDRTTYYLDTGDRVIIWVESLFDPSAVRTQHALLRRAVVTRASVPLRDVSHIYNHIPAMMRDVFAQGHAMRLPTENTVPTEAGRAIWEPMRTFVRIVRFLIYSNGALTVAAFLLLPIAFVLQHLLD